MWISRQSDNDNLANKFITDLEKGQKEKGFQELNLLIAKLRRSVETGTPLVSWI